jgi:hypothetical protein
MQSCTNTRTAAYMSVFNAIYICMYANTHMQSCSNTGTAAYMSIFNAIYVCLYVKYICTHLQTHVQLHNTCYQPSLRARTHAPSLKPRTHAPTHNQEHFLHQERILLQPEDILLREHTPVGAAQLSGEAEVEGGGWGGVRGAGLRRGGGVLGREGRPVRGRGSMSDWLESQRGKIRPRRKFADIPLPLPLPSLRPPPLEDWKQLVDASMSSVAVVQPWGGVGRGRGRRIRGGRGRVAASGAEYTQLYHAAEEWTLQADDCISHILYRQVLCY